MDFNINKFKNIYKIDFEFIENYNELLSYVKDDIVWLSITDIEQYNKNEGKFYIAEDLVNIGIIPPNTPWIVYNNNGLVSDFYIERALNQANQIYNGNRFNIKSAEEALYLLVAHFIATDLNMDGIESSGGSFIKSTSVDGVAISFDIPQKVQDNPTYAQLLTTNYGTKYVGLLYANSITSRIKITNNKKKFGYYPFIPN